jgi:D-sedoheptulose 7-phosphate isomerase
MERISSNIEEHLKVISALKSGDAMATLKKIADIIVASLKNGGKVMIAGNGGSAADAQHIAGEFIGRYLYDRRPLPAMALNTDTAVMTCVANDYSYNDIYLRQVQAIAKKGDVFWGISTSGNSANVVSAAEAAKAAGASVVGFTGEKGGKLKEIAEACYCSPSSRTNRIQEAHMLGYHIVCELMEAALCPKEK